ncbi:hypothetical protein ACLOJK_023415 [Asimina triloba]
MNPRPVAKVGGGRASHQPTAEAGCYRGLVSEHLDGFVIQVVIVPGEKEIGWSATEVVSEHVLGDVVDYE